MIRATCIGVIREDGYSIKGYTLKDKSLKGKEFEHSKEVNFYVKDLIKHIKNGKITVDNLIINSYGELELTDNSIDNLVKDKSTRSFINKTMLLGYTIKEIYTACGHKCYLASMYKEHILRIPNDVTKPTEAYGKTHFTDVLSTLEGNLQVVGGEGIVNADYMFSNCKIDILDLNMLYTHNIESMKSMFRGSHIKNILWGKLLSRKVISLNEVFKGFKCEKLDLSSWDTSNIKYMVSTFEDSWICELIINNFDLSNVKSVENMFAGGRFEILDLSNLVFSNINNTKCIFKGVYAADKIILSNTDSKNKRFRSFEVFLIQEERLERMRKQYGGWLDLN